MYVGVSDLSAHNVVNTKKFHIVPVVKFLHTEVPAY